MLELLQTGFVREAVLLMGLRQAIHEDLAFADELNGLVPQVSYINIIFVKNEVFFNSLLSLANIISIIVDITYSSTIKEA